MTLNVLVHHHLTGYEVYEMTYFMTEDIPILFKVNGYRVHEMTYFMTYFVSSE